MNGSFNKIIVIKNKVFKIENVNDLYSKNILSNFSHNSKTYYEDLKKLGINVARLYFDKKIFGKNIEIQEYIPGESLALYMEDKKVPINDKLDYYEKLLIIYRKTLSSDVALDLNMKNFIISNGDLIYVDLVPSIYKSKLSKENVENDEYKNYYLNNNLAIANVTNYFLEINCLFAKRRIKNNIIKT